jgi:tetratricopeptide (TPR) repeat protein
VFCVIVLENRGHSVKAVKFSTILKWVGYATAILSLIFGIRELVKIVSDGLESHRKVDALLTTEEVELKGRDYASAWNTLEQASKLQPDAAKIQLAQENLAMAWLEDTRVREKQEWSSIVDKLEPVLTRGIASAKDAQRSADLLAHVGWCYFLRTRDGVFGMDPADAYARAVQKDPNNPYAEAMWGHWTLWNGGKLSEASKHFAAGLVSGRHREFVRSLQCAAVSEHQDDEFDEDLMRVANAIRLENGSVDADIPDKISFIFYSRVLRSDPVSNPFLHVLAPAEQIATFHWLFDSINYDEWKSLQRTCYLAMVQEVAGQREEALANYRLIHAKTAKRPGSLADAADAGIKRLSSAH